MLLLGVREEFCFDLSQWRAQDFEWLAPLKAMKLANARDLQDCQRLRMLFLGDPMPLVTFAAQQWHISRSSAEIQRLAKHDYGLELSGGQADILLQGVGMVLTCPDNTAAYLERRLGHLHQLDKEEYEDLLDDVEVAENVDKDAMEHLWRALRKCAIFGGSGLPANALFINKEKEKPKNE